MRTVIMIPARYQSSRFPGKPLVDLCGIPMLVRVWRKCVECIKPEDTYVLTDDKRIADLCLEYGMQFLMTSTDAKTGTDRIYEASKKIEASCYINVQGDEPLVALEDIQKVINAAKDNPNLIFNGMTQINTIEDMDNPNIPKVVTRQDGRLIYMSRAPIPTNKTKTNPNGWKQVCIYAFPPHALNAFGQSSNKCELEAIEDIEILRFLEMGMAVQMVIVSGNSVAVDTPEDADKVRSLLLQ